MPEGVFRQIAKEVLEGASFEFLVVGCTEKPSVIVRTVLAGRLPLHRRLGIILYAARPLGLTFKEWESMVLSFAEEWEEMGQ